MKKLIITSALIAFLGFTATTLLAQAPPHPNGTTSANSPSGESNRVGKGPTGAPLDTADILLITLAALYGVARFTRSKPKEA